jgi:hypothetical protein
MRIVAAVLFALSSLTATAAAQECSSGPPSRVSDQYWVYLDACGCEKADAPSRASSDYERYLKVCSAWRERNQGRIVAVSPSPGLTLKECEKAPPSRISSQYWTFLEACGCEKTDAVSRASSDYERYLKVCSEWRERNPNLTPSPKPTPKP